MKNSRTVQQSILRVMLREFMTGKQHHSSPQKSYSACACVCFWGIDVEKPVGLLAANARDVSLLQPELSNSLLVSAQTSLKGTLKHRHTPVYTIFYVYVFHQLTKHGTSQQLSKGNQQAHRTNSCIHIYIYTNIHMHAYVQKSPHVATHRFPLNRLPSIRAGPFATVA